MRSAEGVCSVANNAQCAARRTGCLRAEGLQGGGRGAGSGFGPRAGRGPGGGGFGFGGRGARD
jgi:hypothetical protein